MSKRGILSALTLILPAALMVGCNDKSTSVPPVRSTPGSVAIFGTDTPLCDVESFVVTITSASLVPQGGGTPVPLITSTAPTTVDFARLADFTNILSLANVTRAGAYTGLQVTVTSPQLVVLNTSLNPPAPVVVPVTLTATTFTITINPALIISSGATSGLILDLNLLQSLEVNAKGQVTGTVDPQISLTPTTPSGTTVGEATALYGVVQSLSTAVPSDFTGSFGLAVTDGTGQALTVLVNSSTVFEGDSVTAFSSLKTNTFVEVDATVSTSGQIIAQTVDAEEQVSAISQNSAFLGKVINVTPDVSGNATSFTLLVDDEVPDSSGTVPLHSGLTVKLTANTNYFTNWQYLNRQAFTFGPQTLGLAQKVAVFGVLGSALPLTLTANQVFLRPLNVVGNFTALKVAGSDGMTGGFTMTPCGGLFGGNAITVLTSSNSVFTGVSGLTALTAAPTLDTTGLLIYDQKTGQSQSATGVIWTGPTWIMQAKGVHQLPN